MLCILCLVGIIGSLVEFIIGIEKSFSSDCDYVWSNTIRMIIFFVIGLIGSFGLSVIDEELSYEEVLETDNWELVSITDDVITSGNGTNGLFYVLMSIDTDDVYSFYYKVDDDGFKRGTVKADNTIVYEKNNCIPHIVEYTTYTKSRMNGILRWILTFGYGEESEKKSYNIYTPKGTILRSFTLDTQ